MKKLITIILILICTTLFSQSDLEFRSLGYVTKSSVWNFETKTMDTEIWDKTKFSFLIMSNKNTTTELLRIHLNAGNGDTTNDYVISETIEPTETNKERTYILYQLFGYDISFTYGLKHFIIHFDPLRVNGVMKYTQTVEGVIISHPTD